MYLSDLNRLEKYLAKFKSCVQPGHEPTADEAQAVQTIRNQVEQIEGILFNLRVAKGSVAGLLVKSLKDARSEELSSIYFTSNEKGFSVLVPIYNLLNNNEHDPYSQNARDWSTQIGEWGTRLVRAGQQHFFRQEVPESEIQMVLNLNQIHPKLRMYSMRFHGALELNFEISKKVAQNDADREMIAREIMNYIQRVIYNKRAELGLPQLAVA